jgi:hypothetical protein
VSDLSHSIRQAALTWTAFDLLMLKCLEGDIADVFLFPGEWKISEHRPDDLRMFWLLVAEALE